jgi:hypothetical protein
VYSCSEKKIRAGFDMSDRTIPLLALADGLCRAWFLYLMLRWCGCPEIGGCSIDWDQLSRFYLKMEPESSLRNLLNKNKTMDNVRKDNTCINVQSSQTFEFNLFAVNLSKLSAPNNTIVNNEIERTWKGRL